MSYRPSVLAIAPCPKCNVKPEFRFNIFRGRRLACRCGISGPYVKDAIRRDDVIGPWNEFIRPDWRDPREGETPPPGSYR